MSESFAERVGDYLATALGVTEVRVDQAAKIVGGASRETWSVHAEWDDGDGTFTGRDLVIRMDPEASLLDSNRRVEYSVYRAFWNVPGVPVPEALFIEDDPAPLGKPFFVMVKVDGAAWPADLLAPQYDVGRPAIAQQMMEILGKIATVDYAALGLHQVVPEPTRDDAWALQLEHWEKVLQDHDMGPNPITMAAIRHLRREPPPPAPRVSVVHGDYRIGNFLFSANRIEAILDWEMAHLGDPHEDLAWCFARNWRSGANPHLMSSLLEREQAIGYWEDASGLRVDADALRWWELFTHVKGNAIWITGGHQFFTGRSHELIYALVGWLTVDKQEMWMLEDMGVVS